MANLTKEQMSTERSVRPYRKVNAARRAQFLRALARTGNVTHSAQHAGLRVRACYEYAKRNKRFHTRWQEQLDVFAGSLEGEAVRRGRDGYFEPVYQNGELVGHKQRYSDRLLETTLRAAMPDKYGKQTIEHVGDANAPIALTAVPAKTTPINIDSLRKVNDSGHDGALDLFDESE